MKRQRTRWLSFLLAVTMVLAMLPPVPLTVRAAENSLQGKTISILGASISTFAGTSNGAAADTTNSTIRGNAKYYPSSVVTDVTLPDTWWTQAASDLGLRLLVNNSWSGSSLLHTRNGTVGAYVDRCVQLHDDTGDNAGEEPDIIAIQMGTNDFQYFKDTLGTAEIDYAALITENTDGTYTYAEPVTSLEAAAIVLHKISVRYPDAEVYYLNISQRVDGTDDLIRSFNAELKKVVEHFDAHIVDIYGSAITMDSFPTHIGDGRVHPNRLGMDAYTEAFKRALLEHTAYTVDTRTVAMELDGVTADYGDDKIVVDGDSFTAKLTAPDSIRVTVTMGGQDITKTAYADGVVTIESVTDDVVITASSVFDAHTYRWEFDGEELACVSGGNALTKNGGSTTDGVFSGTRYALQTDVVLRHDQSWSVEWQCEGTWRNSASSSGGRLFTESDVNADYNVRYIFKSAVNGLIAMGEKTSSGSHNYGVALSDYGIDGNALHTYRLENRVAADGSNMVWLWVDGEEIAPLNHYYIGTKDQKATSDWLSGKDFVFPYIGTDTHGLSDCAISYLEVREGCGVLSMRYDDHLDLSGKTVKILNAGTPTSCKVGYGVAEGTQDDAVVALEGNTLLATGIGTARVTIDGQLYDVTVTAAPISLILLAGQSNMQGSEGNADQSIVCPDGQVYSTYGDRYTMTVSNATNFAPSALTGSGSGLNVNGTTANLKDWPVYLLNEAGAGKAGPDSGFAYEWVQQTGEKIWVVNAAHGGSSITTWQDGGDNYEEAIILFSACQETLRKEIAAGHYTLSHMGYFWCQGCTDYSRTAAWYVEKYLTMHDNFKSELAFDHDSDSATADKVFEFGGIIPVRAGHEYYTSYRQGAYTDTTTAKYHESFLDLRFTGPRVAQYWMCNNPELEDIWMVCNIGEDWVWMPNGANGVSDYFQAHYENGTVDYVTQVAQNTSWYTPTTPAAVHDSIHYNQIGYNEIGRESVRNALIMLGEMEALDMETSVELLSWDGYTPADQITAAAVGSSETLVVPKVYPVWKSKEVTYAVSEGLRWDYYDLLAADAQTTGSLTANEKTVHVVKADPGSHYADHLSELPEEICRGLNLWSVLEHDKYFYSNGTHWSIHSSGTVYSVTIPAKAGDLIYATSFGAAGNNGHSATNGIRMTFFSEYGVVKTLDPAGTYAEFTANGGCLIAPEGTVAVNIPMWTNSDSNELYILNHPHDTTGEVCSICGKDSHIHDWSDWETVTEPGMDGPGEEKRSCACGQTERRELLSIWQTTNILYHWNELPGEVCRNLNLWSVLEHDPKYYVVSNGDWGYHSSRDVPSVTFALNPGDKLFATSFGAADVNGHGSQSGIRVTFFDIDGVVKTMVPSETYAEFTANGGYLIAPGGTIAVNVAMWNDSDDNEIYILNREHHYNSVVTLPACTEQGYTTHTCACGDSYRTPWLDERAYEGRTIACVGDSITAAVGVTKDENDYVKLLSEQLGMDYIRLGVSGTTLCTDGSRTCNIGRLTEDYLNGADVVTIAMGINDFCAAGAGFYELGDIDSTDSSTICGAVRMWCERIAELRNTDSLRHTQFYFVTPLITSWNNSVTSGRNWDQAKTNIHGYTLRDLCNAIMEVAALYDVAVIDLNLVSGLYYVSPEDNNTAVFGGDGVHPGAEGHGMMARAIANALLQNDLRDDHAHTFGSWITTTWPSCTEGRQQRVCTVCTATESRTVEAADHSWGEWKVTTAPTCTKPGQERRDCENCDHYETREVAATGHDYESVVTEPTCTQRGYTTHTCACGDSFVDSWRDALGHRYGEWEVTTAPTCTKPGQERRDCENCDNHETREVAATGHDYESVVTESTCTAKGFTTYTCACGDSYVDSWVDALGHSWGEWEVIRDPTAEAPGLRQRVCGSCGATENEEIPQLEITYGDTNGDGRVNSLDVILLRQYLADWDVEPDMTAADVNGNGSVNTLDLIVLRQYLAGWDVTLGPQ